MPNLPLPASAMQRIPQIQQANQALINTFESHSVFASQATRRTGKIYFMWDFAKRTDAMFQSILHNYPPPDTPATRGSIPNVPPACMTDAQREELKEDAVGRCMMLWTMIKDTSGKTGMMFGEQPGQGVELGDAVKSASQGVSDVIFEGHGESTQSASS